MTDLTQARKQLRYWKKQYDKAYLYRKNTWDFDVRHAATECARWKAEVSRLKDEYNARTSI